MASTPSTHSTANRRKRRRRRSNHDQCNDDDNDIMMDNPTTTTTSTSLYIPPLKRTNRTRSPPPKQNNSQADSTYMLEATESLVKIHTTIEHKKSKVTEHLVLTFKLTIFDDVGGDILLQLKENEKRMRTATSAGLNKYKKKVIELLLLHYFNYKAPSDAKLGKAKLLSVLCACVGIPIESVDDLIGEFLTQDVVKRIYDFMNMQQPSLLIDIRETAKQNKSLNMNDEFDMDYYSVFWENDKVFVECLEIIWKQLNDNWKQNPREEAMLKAFLKMCASFKNDNKIKELCEVFNSSITFNTWNRFIYGVFNSAYDHYKKMLRQELICIALEQAKQKPSPEQKDTNEKLYLTHGMANSTLNSLLRKYHGFNFRRNKKICLVTTVNYMLFQYNDLNQFLKESKAPKRLALENRGGLRIIKDTFCNISGSIIDAVTPHLHNVFLTYGGDLKALLQSVLNETAGFDEFQTLFDIVALKKKIQTFVNRKYNGECKEEEEHKSEENISLEEVNVALTRVHKDFVRGIAVRCIWSYIKRLRPNDNTLTLRGKLQFFHMTDKPKHSSLQVE
eukprot:203688_1